MAEATETVSTYNSIEPANFGQNDFDRNSKKHGNAPLSGVRKGSKQWNRMVGEGLIKE